MMTLPGKILGQKLFGGKPTATDIEMGETEGWGYGASMLARACPARRIPTNKQPSRAPKSNNGADGRGCEGGDRER